ncbi:MAG: acetolactate synthase small subunit [Chlorobiales bacterium]|nr:acetolactate synthase small subunit [Chlorobiales bacterium]
MKHIISVLVENKFGALNRVAAMFSARGFNLQSISIGETEDPEISRMTIVTRGDDQIIGQIVKQLNRLIDTIKVVDLMESPRVERELALITLNYQKMTRAEILDLCGIFKARIVDINPKTITVEVTGPPDKVDAAINVLVPYGIKEMARSGMVALPRGEQHNRLNKEKEELATI